MPYKFDYKIQDETYYTDFAHEEYSDDKGVVKGSYKTYLPDGRTQTVKYRDEGYGYIADVSYEGYGNYKIIRLEMKDWYAFRIFSQISRT